MTCFLLLRMIPLWKLNVSGVFCSPKAPVYTKFILMNCLLGNTNFLKSASSGLGYASFYIIPTDGATMYFKLGSGSGSGRIQTDYWVKLREKDKNYVAYSGVWTHEPKFLSPMLYQLSYRANSWKIKDIRETNQYFCRYITNFCQTRGGVAQLVIHSGH